MIYKANKKMASSGNHRGFSLLELLISMAISVIAVLTAVGVMSKFARTVGAFTEVSTMEEARGTSETLLRADFDGAGRSLTRSTPPLAGTIFATPNSFTNYSSSNGTITKTGPGGWENWATMTHVLTSGLTAYSFTPPDTMAIAAIGGANGNSFSLNILNGDPSTGVPLTIYANSTPVAASYTSYTQNTTILPHLAGDSYFFKIENGTSGRVVKLYRLRNNIPGAIWSTESNLTYPITFSLNIFNQGQSFRGVRITGAPLVALTGNQTELAPLPSDNNTPLTAPITTTGGGAGATILSGDSTTDAVATLADFNQSSTQLVARPPHRGSFKPGDYVLIIDWGSRDPATPGGAASALCQVTALSTTSTQVALSIQRIRQANAAWGRLWSTDTDHTHTFATGSSLVKLQPPVSYAVSSDARLVRIEGNRVSTTGFNLRRATFARYSEFNNPALMFLVTLTLAAEGVETSATTTDETRGTIEFRSTPRALNLASNRLN